MSVLIRSGLAEHPLLKGPLFNPYASFWHTNINRFHFGLRTNLAESLPQNVRVKKHSARSLKITAPKMFLLKWKNKRSRMLPPEICITEQRNIKRKVLSALFYIRELIDACDWMKSLIDRREKAQPSLVSGLYKWKKTRRNHKCFLLEDL